MQQGTKSYLLFRQEISRPGLEIRKWIYKSKII